MKHKLARICWNDNRWQRPSGTEGKTKNKDSFEYIYGFGHEEWLFDTSKIIDGYHYGFVQAIGANRGNYQNDVMHLSLYSIDNRTKQRWWLGTIRNLIVVNEEESSRIHQIYEEQGWLEQMSTQLALAGADVKAFKKYITHQNFAVIKYKVEELNLFDSPLEFEHGDPAVTSDYYNLKNYIQQPKLKALSEEFQFRTGHIPSDRQKRLEYDWHERDVNNYHNHIQTLLFNKLCEQYGSENVGAEINTGAGSRVDVVVRSGKEYALYEIKTGPSLRACVREAVGQLLEYRHVIGHSKVSKLVVVSPHPPDKWIENYLNIMRTEHSLPIYYQQCSS